MKKVVVVLGHSKKPWRQGKRSLGSNGTRLTVRFVDKQSLMLRGRGSVTFA